MDDILQVAFLCIVCLLGGGLATVALVGTSIFAGRRGNS